MGVVGSLYFLLDSILSVLLVRFPSDALQGGELIPPCQVVPPLRIAKRLIATIFARLILFVLGFWWIPVEVVNKKRGYAGRISHTFHLPNSLPADEIRRMKAGAHVPGTSSSQTGYRGSNYCGSRSGAALPFFPPHVRSNRWSPYTGSIRHSSSQSQIPFNSTPTPLPPPLPKHPAAEPVRAQPQSHTPLHSHPKTDSRLPTQRSSVSKSFHFGP